MNGLNQGAAAVLIVAMCAFLGYNFTALSDIAHDLHRLVEIESARK